MLSFDRGVPLSRRRFDHRLTLIGLKREHQLVIAVCHFRDHRLKRERWVRKISTEVGQAPGVLWMIPPEMGFRRPASTFRKRQSRVKRTLPIEPQYLFLRLPLKATCHWNR